ncbi:glycosyltransferase family 4 protein [Candidatus Bathyarchaeota archaeon]|nr:glycosyltransferase family 4 protein [Candidatus Bathyarchaeota archaeon]
MRVLLITPHVFAGGAEKAALNLAYHLNLMGCDVSIATLSLDLGKLPDRFAKLEYLLPEKNVEPYNANGVYDVLKSISKEFYALTSLVRKFSPEFDVLGACNFPSYWSTCLANGNKPVVWLCSEVLGPYGQTRDFYERNRFFRLAFESAKAIDKMIVNIGVNKIITCSEVNSRLIRERYGRESVVIHTGVDYEFFSENVPDAKDRLGLSNSILLLHVGSLIPRKNHILSIRAMKILKQKFNSVKLVIVGEGPWKPILLNEVERLHLEGDVIFMGIVSEDELRCLYRACDVNLFPAEDQTWGLVPFEALAAGKPSIVATSCGAALIMGKEKIGFIINPSVENLVEAVTQVLKNDELIEDMVRRGQRFVRENLTWESYARKVHSVFKEVLSSE